MAWTGMRNRCSNPHNAAYKDYGGRGIQVHPSWNNYQQFLSDVGRAPTPNHSIDRIDVNGHYEPGNVRWATWKTQARNRRDNNLLTIDSKTLTIADWAEQVSIKPRTIKNRLARGWSPDKAVFTPIRA